MSSIAFGLFILCPRMAGMASVISKATEASLWEATMLGMVFAFPLVMGMVFIFAKWGLIPALISAVVAYLLAALAMREVSFRKGLETVIIGICDYESQGCQLD